MNPCMVRIGGPGNERERSDRPFRPCALPTDFTREVHGEVIPVCTYHRIVPGIVAFSLDEVGDPNLRWAIKRLLGIAA